MSTPTLAVWKFASCDGCQLTLLDCEDELLTIAEEVQIATFLEASSAIVAGPYDVSLVEGSITTAADERRIKEIREQSKTLVTIGACADRRWGTGVTQFRRYRGVHLCRLRQARIHRHARDLDSRVRTRQDRLPVAGLSDRPRPAARHPCLSAGRA